MTSLARVLVSIAVTLAVGLAAVLAVFVIGVRAKNPKVLRAVRVVQRDVLNPGAMRGAGTHESPWTVIRHRGRTSGKEYETPIATHREGDEFFVTLPYGRGTQWLQNVLAADGATLVVGGEEIAVFDPRIVPIETTPMAQRDRAAIAVFGVTEALVLRTAPA
ncbi:nitroreductase/quinone reductase family protein [Microbacterium xanthum]|uniref:nitroreductase/quinone reductase family protein n=1 Tax=Microbacterium xanthum TaxID=3079794 RepID=UPI002AD4696E|nr:nitroreductase/quinone reductase family protein [Microbacterium sp. KSW-48]MDZ8172959.1 nitroreductase/quinone reductase family protein [Microbacterium sp. KSW-48]